jgi:hypothetical protein
MAARRITRLALPAALVALAAPAFAGSAAAGGNGDSVTLSGKAYTFNHMDEFIEGATIRIRERRNLRATTDTNGDWRMEVPDDANLTPYIVPPETYNQIDLQTLHTRGEDLQNVNFQTPADAEYAGLAALLDVQLGPDGRPERCVIVTTSSARNVRGVDYETFRERTPHGVAGATSVTVPLVPGPIYFNDSVIPDPSQTESSGDGGIIWTEVPAGTYRVITESPETHFASFLATCEPGRVVNANPPWGAYELRAKEAPLGASVVAATVKRATVNRGPAGRVRNGASRRGRRVVIRVDAGEPVHLRAALRRGGRRIGGTRRQLSKGRADIEFPVGRRADRGRAKLKLRLRDRAGDAVNEVFRVRVPARRR